MKWIEVNINCNSLSKNQSLMTFVKPIVTKFHNIFQSWHFLWEQKPYSTTLMVRFYGTEKTIASIKNFLEELLKEIEHAYGCQGNCEKDAEYKGESNHWGSKGWDHGMKFLELGSEFALDLVENEANLGNNEEYIQDIFYYVDRYTHLFLNQISSLNNEADFYLDEGIFRYLLGFKIQLSQKQMKEIRKKIEPHILAESKKL